MNKKLLCTAIGTALAATSGLARASHDLLIPYVVKDANRTTVVSLIGEAGKNGIGIAGSERALAASNMHLQYWTKSTTDANTAACQPSSVTVPFTDNDIMTFDTAGILGYPLFGDSTNPAPLGTAISYAAPRHGYLVAENSGGGLYRGYWLELDLANGGAHGDAGQLNFGGPTGAFNIETNPWIALLAGRPFNTNGDGAPAAAVPFWPSSVASTVFTVTPLGTNMLTRENNQIVLQVLNSTPVQGAYDRNENGVDGTVPITVRCVGRVTPAQLMPGVVTNAAWAAQGGWGFLANLGDPSGVLSYTRFSFGTTGLIQRVDNAAAIYQVDSSSAGGKFMTNATRITSHAGLVEITAPSDRRLKRDITRIGTTQAGFGLYSYRYLWDDQVRTGVMAQEVMVSRPDAVLLGEDGYYRVNYSRLGLAHLLH